MLKYLNYKLAIEKGKKRINQLLSLTLAWCMSVNTLFTTALHAPVASLVEAFFWLNYNPRLLGSKLKASVIQMLTLEFQMETLSQINLDGTFFLIS